MDIMLIITFQDPPFIRKDTQCFDALTGCVVDPHHFDANPDADPDSTYHPDADPDADSDSDFY
jgi:hypothetical protein